jgi:Zn ribbon nucleic-acid-binding protein
MATTRRKNSVRCPECGEPSRVTSTRTYHGCPVRHRKCLACGHRFQTREAIIGRATGPTSISVTNLLNNTVITGFTSRPTDLGQSQ